MTLPSEEPCPAGIPRPLQETLSRMAEVLFDYVALVQPQGQVVYLNKKTRELTEQAGALPPGFLLAQLQPGWVCALLREEGIPVALNEGSWRGETAILRADG